MVCTIFRQSVAVKCMGVILRKEWQDWHALTTIFFPFPSGNSILGLAAREGLKFFARYWTTISASSSSSLAPRPIMF